MLAGLPSKDSTKNKLKLLVEELILFVIGGCIYMGIEIAARGFTHWSMGIVGGLCFVIIGLLNEIFTWNMLFQTQCFIGAITITALEYISGCILNIWLGWNIWDYSDRPFNLNGQICLQNCFYWVILSAVAILLDDYIRYYVFKEEKPRYYFIKKK